MLGKIKYIEKILKVSDLKFADYNPRTITKDAYRGLTKSIKKYGLNMPILVNSDNTIISGHQRVRVCKDLGVEEVKCYVYDLERLDEEELNILMNSSAISGEFEEIQLAEMLENQKDREDYKELQLDKLEPLDLSEENTEELYTDKIKGLLYEPSQEKPNIKELVSDSKTKKLIEKIKNSNLSNEEKDFLILAAQRHLIFNYSNIADYYAHSEKDMQNLMEESALIIIDSDKALELGFLELQNKILEDDEI
jgi:hypothetical protein